MKRYQVKNLDALSLLIADLKRSDGGQKSRAHLLYLALLAAGVNERVATAESGLSHPTQVRTSNNIARIRQDLGLSQKEVAERIGISSAHLSQYETGTMTPRTRIALRIVRVLSTTAEECFSPPCELRPRTFERFTATEPPQHARNTVHDYRHRHRIPLSELASMTGCNPRFLGRIEKQGVDVSVDTALLLARALQTTVALLFAEK